MQLIQLRELTDVYKRQVFTILGLYSPAFEPCFLSPVLHNGDDALHVFRTIVGLVVDLEMCIRDSHHIGTNAEGRRYIRINRKKTKVEAFIPLHPIAEPVSYTHLGYRTQRIFTHITLCRDL